MQSSFWGNTLKRAGTNHPIVGCWILLLGLQALAYGGTIESTTPEPGKPVVSVEAIDSEAAELGPDGQPGVAVFRFTRTGATNFDQPVSFGFYCPLCKFARPMAVNGVDFEQVPTTIIIPRGSAFADLVIKPIPDKALEGDEPLPVWVEEPPCDAVFPPPRDCYVVGDGRLALATIHDSTLPGSARIAIVEPRPGAVFVDPPEIVFQADTFDPKGTFLHLDWFAGDIQIGVTDIVFIRPPDPGIPLTHEFHWKNPPAGDHLVLAISHDATGSHVIASPILVRVVRDGTQDTPVVSITVTAHTSECPPKADCDIGAGRFTLKRVGALLDQPLTVHLTYGGSAAPGVDYTSLPPTVTFEAGRDAAELLVHATADLLVEGAETVDAMLSTETGPQGPRYLIGSPSSATVTIGDSGSWSEIATLEFTEPKEGQRFAVGDIIRISVIAVDQKADIRHVELYDGRELIGISEHLTKDAVIPGRPRTHVFEWSGGQPGAHELIAMALDSASHIVVSKPLHVWVGSGNGPDDLKIATIGYLPDASIQLVLHGDPAQIHYNVEASTDLIHWEKIGEFTPGNFSFFYTDPAPQLPGRFYRAVEGKAP